MVNHHHIMPITGGLFYIYTKSELGHRILKKTTLVTIENSKNTLNQDSQVNAEVKAQAPSLTSLNTYINRTGNFPICNHTSVKYFPLGEAKFKDLLEELQKVHDFILKILAPLM